MKSDNVSVSGRVLLAGQIVFNAGRSAINCTVRNLFDRGAYLEVLTPVGIPDRFDLSISGNNGTHHCKREWQTANRMGVSFIVGEENSTTTSIIETAEKQGAYLRGELLALRAALDVMELGIVLLDNELRAQFINRAFRDMWRLPDSRADSKPPFVALMYHGRDTGAYELGGTDVDAYVAERVSLVKGGDPKPLDIRLSNGLVVRYQCAVLPNNGRMLSYTYVSDIVRHSDQLEILKAALDRVQDGVVLLDDKLRVTFMNRSVRDLWRVSDKQADSVPAYAHLVNDARVTGTYDVALDQLDLFIKTRIDRVRAGDPTPQDIRTTDGKVIRTRCTAMPTSGRMITYTDVTDLIRNTEELERLATTDAMSELYNRRHFLLLADIEWSRYQRYQRPLAALVIDIDHFKTVNDRFGHDVGDEVLIYVAKACRECKRSTDIVGRIGGDEIVILLPETDDEQAGVVAERLRVKISNQKFVTADFALSVTVSIGIAVATLSMSGVPALMKMADQGLYEAKFAGRNRIGRATLKLSSETKEAAE